MVKHFLREVSYKHFRPRTILRRLNHNFKVLYESAHVDRSWQVFHDPTTCRELVYKDCVSQALG